MEGGVSSQYIWSLRSSNSPVACLYDNNGDFGNANGNVTDAYSTDWRCYYTTDANGNVTGAIRVDYLNRAVTDSNYIKHYSYTAYGTMTVYNRTWGVVNDESNFDGPRYAGYWYDHETGLYQDRNRYYDSTLGRFINRDPIGYSGGNNLYAYCAGNPINATDPSGLKHQAATPLEICAVLSDAAYYEGETSLSRSLSGWKMEGAKWYDKDSGCTAFLFHSKEKDQYIFAFRGTTTIKDVNADGQQHTVSAQYLVAVQWAKDLHRKYGNKVTLTGHSLGGGLASAGAMVTGLQAIVFNAAGLSSGTATTFDMKLTGTHRNIRSYYVPGEALTNYQENTSGKRDWASLVRVGEQTALPTPSVGGWTRTRQAINLHSMESVLKALNLD